VIAKEKERTMAESQIARLRQQIQDEYAAAYRGLHEYATVARHEIITHRFDKAGQYIDQLARFVGEEEAQRISTQIYMQVTAEGTTQEGQAVGSGPAQASQVEVAVITIRAYLKWEGAQFLRDHGCHVEHYTTGDLITFPAGSSKAQLTRISRYCNTITLPDATEITSIENEATSILLLIDLANQQTVHLSF
jgi:hypothetical protein